LELLVVVFAIGIVGVDILILLFEYNGKELGKKFIHGCHITYKSTPTKEHW